MACFLSVMPDLPSGPFEAEGGSMHRLGSVLTAALLFAVGACEATPTRWQRAGTTDAAKDEAECRANARQEAVRQLPYGNGPPIFFYPKVSMLQWTQAIDNERSYIEDNLTKACMRQRGFELARPSG